MLYPWISPIALCILIFLPAATKSSPPEETPPNILLILTDDQGYHDVSYYGTEDLQTPHIDQIAAEGMRFDNFYANCPVCSPTRAALLTGRYQDYVGVLGVIRTHADNNWAIWTLKLLCYPSNSKWQAIIRRSLVNGIWGWNLLTHQWNGALTTFMAG